MEISEESTYVLTLSATDETGVAATITAATWTLTNEAGTVINSRTAVALVFVGGAATIVLKGDDLAIGSSDNGKRKLLVSATYNSTNGTGLPLNKEHAFTIKDLAAVT